MQEYRAHIISAKDSNSSHSRLEELKNIRGVKIFDTIEIQIFELLKSRNPKIKISQNSKIYQQLREDYLKDSSADMVGNWVYFPWNNVLIHILSETEFVEVRTNRNKYKITDAQQTTLSTKKIGVIGLSVGKTVAITMAMERMFGEIRLADFDDVELSNLNRIRTSLINMSTNKAIVVAREIAEFDPYLKVVVYDKGITEDNIDDFFTLNGKLDLLVEECDGLDIKIIARQKARDLCIPVVMETNDRAMLDIERFDLEPNRPILHGLVEDLNIETLKSLKTNEDKVPYMLKMIGIQDTSVLLRASMLEIEQSLTTWPQLASSVTYGGGIVADISRRILLGESAKSGRFYFDVERELIEDSNYTNEYSIEKSTSLSLDTIQKVANSYPASKGVSLSKQQITELVSLAHTAPSGGNMQPWRWYAKSNQLFAFVDASLASSFLDYNSLGGMVGFGAAVENVVIGASKMGLTAKYDYVFNENSPLVAVIDFETNSNANANNLNLYSSIYHRGTNRMLGNLKPINPDYFKEISNAAELIPGAQLVWIEERKDELGKILSAIERIRILTQRGHSDFIDEIRWTTEEAERTKDGIDLRTIDLTETEKAGLIVSKDYQVAKQLREWGLGTGIETMMRKSIENTERIGFISMTNGSQESYFEGGRALQRAWLKATQLNLGFHPISPATFIFNRYVNDSNDEQLTPFKEELNTLRTNFEEILGLDNNRGEIFLFRLFEGKEIQTRSLRRNIEEHLFFEKLL